MLREPLLLLAAALASGILLGHLVTLPPAPLAALLTTTAVLSVFTCLLQNLHRLRLGAFVLLLFCAGLETEHGHRLPPAPQLSVADGETALLSGCLSDPPVYSENREQFTLDLAPGKSARVTLNLANNERLPLTYGQQIEAAAKVRTPRNFGNPDAFDYVAYLASRHIYWNATVAGASDVRVLPGRCGSPGVALLMGIRTWALGRIESLYPGDRQTSALLQATLLGETSGVEKRWTNDFRVTGTYHALVISGQHVSVLAFTILLLLRLLRLRRVPSLCVATVACWLYALISGFSSPVVRAAGGFTLFLVASYFFRRTRVLNVLAAIGLIYLLFAPSELFDPSFQLSFLSAAAIAAFAVPLIDRYTQPLRAAVKRFDQVAYDPMVEMRAAQWRVELRLLARTVNAWLRLSEAHGQTVVAWGAQVAAFVAEAVLISACVQFGLALPMISYFHRLSITGLTANIVVIPVLSLVVPTGFAALFTLWHPFAWVTRQLLQFAEGVASWHVQFEPAWRMGAIPLTISISFALSLLALAWTIRQYRRYLALPLAASLALFGALCFQPWAPLLHPGQLEVTAIDVGQGDSLFVAFPDGTTMLVDAGGFPGFGNMKRKPQLEIGEDVVSPYLWSRRVRHLDYVVLSHGHSDHMGGLPAILDNFRPRELWIGAEPESDEWNLSVRHARADGVKIVMLGRESGARTIGGAAVRFLAPAPDYLPGPTAHNNDSLVFEIAFRKRSVLFTGDAELPIEADLVASGALHPVTLLKVGHHGSKTSSSADFLDQLNAQFAFISDGYQNQFHHPHPTVLARLADRHISVRRTDERGLSTFLTDGDQVHVSSFH